MSDYLKVQEKGYTMSHHLQITKNATRLTTSVAVTLASIHQETPTIKRFRFNVKHLVDGLQTRNRVSIPIDTLKFKPGQWLDLCMPHLPTVGGFSLCSTPKDFVKNRFVDIAIRYTHNTSIAKWFHEQARPGDEAFIRFGGDFYYQSSTAARRILLIAGGVGISPLYSILQHTMEENRIRGKTNGQWPISIGLLYSYRTESEALFKKALEFKFYKENTGLLAMLMVASRESHRLNQEDVLDAIQVLDPAQEGMEIYLCGPPNFENAMLSHIQQLKRPKLTVFHEKWW